ncbi:MAG: Integral rane sensor signal transduction histidine kinase [Pedosphaera sp.]|nr:Integral rane sensor signal transduction histidine kinase [Pedosphaera sp.]
MRKVALVFVVAVFVPSLVLAWLAVRSLRDQQFVLERQQSLLYQGVADSLAKQAENYLAERQHEFAQQVETMLANHKSQDIARSFDDRLRTNWPLAEVGFVVNSTGDMLCPSPAGRPAAQEFCADYSRFLGNRESAQVYWNANSFSKMNGNSSPAENNSSQNSQAQSPQIPALANNDNRGENTKNGYISKLQQVQVRNVVPQQQSLAAQGDNNLGQYSKVASSEAEFRQLIGDSSEGSVARFLENKLNVLLWYRSPGDSNLVFGAQIYLPRIKADLKTIVQQLDPALQEDVAAVLLDDAAKPVALSRSGFQADWKHPFVATEVGEALPHWEMAVYLLNPAKLTQSAHTLKVTFGLLIALLLLAIGVGSWLIVTDLNRQLTLARQKTDFVSNVSHELKTPLTSIRMFSELLAEGRVTEPDKQRSYLNIITAEAARLTRLINNVLDFSRLDRGEKKYNMQPCDLSTLVRETVETYRPHLEANAFQLVCEWPESSISVQGDRDALAQIVVNLLSNAEKYSDGRKEILVQIESRNEPLPHAEVRILDRGLGVPRGCEEKIFLQFYRAHDSLGSGIQGSGLGLTLARQIARAHGGDVVFHSRPDGGSCFTLRLPTPMKS